MVIIMIINWNTLLTTIAAAENKFVKNGVRRLYYLAGIFCGGLVARSQTHILKNVLIICSACYLLAFNTLTLIINNNDRH